MCDDRRAVLFESWKQLGGKIGSSEWDIKTHAQTLDPSTVPAPKVASAALGQAQTNGGGAQAANGNADNEADEFVDAPLASDEALHQAAAA